MIPWDNEGMHDAWICHWYRNKSLQLACCLVTIMLAVTSCGLLPVDSNEDDLSAYDPALVSEILEYQGVSREVLLYVPRPLPESGVPLVIMLHSEGGTPEQAMQTTAEGRWNELAFREKFIVAYPQGWRGYWNDCRAGGGDRSTQQDDVGFLLKVIELASAQYPVDQRQVFAAGHSNGGMMALRLALEAPGAFAAVFSNNGLLPADSECTAPQEAVPIMLLAGTQDPLMPFEGGPVGLNGDAASAVISAPATVEKWLGYLGLTSEPEITALPDRDQQDRSTVTRVIYEDDAAALWFYQVNGGGHAWPGKQPFSRLEQQTNGNKNGDLQAADHAWAFFKAMAQK